MTREFTPQELSLLTELRARVVQVRPETSSFPYSLEEWSRRFRLPFPDLPRTPAMGESVWIDTQSFDPDLDAEQVQLTYKDELRNRPTEMYTFRPIFNESIDSGSKDPLSKKEVMVLDGLEKYTYAIEQDFTFPHPDFNTLGFSVVNQISRCWEIGASGKRTNLEITIKMTLPGVVFGESFFEEAPAGLVESMHAKKGKLFIENSRSYFFGSETIVYVKSPKGVLVRSKERNLGREVDLTLQIHKFPKILGEPNIIALGKGE